MSRSVLCSPMLEMGYIQWVEKYGPLLKSQGYTRLMWHNPGGMIWLSFSMPDDHRGGEAKELAKARGCDTRAMWINSWQLAEQAGCQQASRSELAAATAILQELYAIEEVIFYVGSPETISGDIVKQGMEYLEPFLLPGASIAFDHAFTRFQASKQLFWQGREVERDKECAKLVTKLRKAGFPVFIELRDGIGAPKIDGTIAELSVDARYHQDMEPYYAMGEVQRIAYGPVPLAEIQSWDKRITPVVSAWQTIKASELD